MVTMVSSRLSGSPLPIAAPEKPLFDCTVRAFTCGQRRELRSKESACLPATFAKRCPTVCEELAGARSSLRPGRTLIHIGDGSKRIPRDFFDPTPEQQNVV